MVARVRYEDIDMHIVVCHDCGALVYHNMTIQHDKFHNHEHLTLGKIGQ